MSKGRWGREAVHRPGTGPEGGGRQGCPVRWSQRRATSGQRGLFLHLCYVSHSPTPPTGSPPARDLPSCLKLFGDPQNFPAHAICSTLWPPKTLKGQLGKPLELGPALCGSGVSTESPPTITQLTGLRPAFHTRYTRDSHQGAPSGLIRIPSARRDRAHPPLTLRVTQPSTSLPCVLSGCRIFGD